jgi:hypothetical protein
MTAKKKKKTCLAHNSENELTSELKEREQQMECLITADMKSIKSR